MNEPNWPCDVRFEGPFGKSRCLTCGREWEAMTPKGSQNHCVRELGSRLALAKLQIFQLEQQLDAAEEFNAADEGGYMAALDEARTRHSDAILRIVELEKALRALRPFIQNITLRAVIDEALPKETPMP